VHSRDQWPTTRTSSRSFLAITSARQGTPLPDAAKADDGMREITIDVAGRFTATITFRRFHHKRGKVSRWFWTPHSAEVVE
jgi:hypothetical protein